MKEILVKEVLFPFTTLRLPHPAPLILTPLPSSLAEGIERLSKCKQNRQVLKDVKCLEAPSNSSICSLSFVHEESGCFASKIRLKSENPFRSALGFGVLVSSFSIHNQSVLNYS